MRACIRFNFHCGGVEYRSGWPPEYVKGAGDPRSVQKSNTFGSECRLRWIWMPFWASHVGFPRVICE